MDEAASALSDASDAVLAPTFDGGYVLIGLRRVIPQRFRNMPWGTERVLEQTRQRLSTQGYRWSKIRAHHPSICPKIGSGRSSRRRSGSSE